jgi:hypothetical protein
MNKQVMIGEEIHAGGDPGCARCREGYPEPCPCGGLIHAAETGEEDPDGNLLLITACDECGRSEDQLEEV